MIILSFGVRLRYEDIEMAKIFHGESPDLVCLRISCDISDSQVVVRSSRLQAFAVLQGSRCAYQHPQMLLQFVNTVLAAARMNFSFIAIAIPQYLATFRRLLVRRLFFFFRLLFRPPPRRPTHLLVCKRTRHLLIRPGARSRPSRWSASSARAPRTATWRCARRMRLCSVLFAPCSLLSCTRTSLEAPHPTSSARTRVDQDAARWRPPSGGSSRSA
jgi:hypothetical protein